MGFLTGVLSFTIAVKEDHKKMKQRKDTQQDIFLYLVFFLKYLSLLLWVKQAFCVFVVFVTPSLQAKEQQIKKQYREACKLQLEQYKAMSTTKYLPNITKTTRFA